MGGASFHSIHSLVGKWKVSLVQMDQYIVVIQRRSEHLLCVCVRDSERESVCVSMHECVFGGVGGGGGGGGQLYYRPRLYSQFCTLTLMSSNEVPYILWDSFSVRSERDSRARS